MLFEKIESEGLAHYSYIIGDQNQAVVIDPKRDIDLYLEKATEAGYKVKYILETHRNEDYIIGSTNLKNVTGAEIWHADHNLDYKYGNEVKEGKVFKIGRLKIEAVHTPGHTLNSFSYLLYDFSEEPLMIFTGDLLFAGDTGRVDLMGEDMMDQLADKLYGSIYNKILPLGDGVIICPAHGAGSVCGETIAERELTTIGLEKKVNPHLQFKDKNDFINNIKEVLERPPYFRKMEKENLIHTKSINELGRPKALSPKKFKQKCEDSNTLILDSRNELNFSAAHITNSLSIWKDGLASFAGWFIPSVIDIFIISPDNYPKDELNILHRIGYDNIVGYLEGGLLKWHMAGFDSERIGMTRVKRLCKILDGSKEITLVDIRSKSELKENGEIKEALHIHLTQLEDNLDQIPNDKPIYVFCGSGLRSTTAASILKRNNFSDLNVVLGGLNGWSSITCPIV